MQLLLSYRQPDDPSYYVEDGDLPCTKQVSIYPSLTNDLIKIK